MQDLEEDKEIDRRRRKFPVQVSEQTVPSEIENREELYHYMIATFFHYCIELFR